MTLKALFTQPLTCNHCKLYLLHSIGSRCRDCSSSAWMDENSSGSPWPVCKKKDQCFTITNMQWQDWSEKHWELIMRDSAKWVFLEYWLLNYTRNVHVCIVIILLLATRMSPRVKYIKLKIQLTNSHRVPNFQVLCSLPNWRPLLNLAGL